MKKRQKTQKILAVYDAADEIEQVINELRNIGVAARAIVVDTSDAFEKALSDTLFDLMICMASLNDWSVEQGLETLHSSQNDCPVICITQKRDIDRYHQLLKIGVTRLLTEEEEVYLHILIKQELMNHSNKVEKTKADISLQDAERRCRLLLKSSRDAIAYIADGMHILVNDSYVELFDYEDGDDIAAMPVLDMVHKDSSDTLKNQLKEFKSAKHVNPDEQQSTVITCVTSKGECFDAQIELTPATYEGEDCIQLVMHKKVEQTLDLALQQKLQAMSKQDLMTGLANRHSFEEELQNCVDNKDEHNTDYFLFYIHLDKFSQHRSKIGVHGVDTVIKDIASLLRDVFEDNTLIARFGEDTYTALLSVADKEVAATLGQQVCQAISNHLFDIETQTIQLTTSVGITQITSRTENNRMALGQAFSACLTAQEDNGGNTLIVFSEQSNDDELVSQTTSAAELQKAIENNLFKILFQPIVNLRGENSEYYEVLLRRVSESGTLESPEAFLATAESAKVATIVDRWVILQSVKALITKRMEGSTSRILINLTSQSLQDKTFLPWLNVALKATRLPDDSVTFQITEADANRQLKRVQELSEELKELKCALSISRFGNAEYSDNILKHVCTDYLKMDAEFTQKIDKPEIKARFTEINKNAKARNITTVASFVESASTLSALWMVGVDYIQGYYISPPLEAMNYDFSQDEDM